MKSKGMLVSLFLLLCITIFSQDKDCPTCPPNGSDQTEYDVIKTKDMMYEGEYVPGEILIKYKAEVNPVLGKTSKGHVVTGISAVDAVFKKHKVTEAKKLFPQAERLQQRQILKSFNGYEFERPSLHNIHKIKISEEAERLNLFEAIEELKQIPEIEYAEPNYIYSIIDSEALSPGLSEEETLEWINKQGVGEGEKGRINEIQAVVPNDPLYSEQWSIPATQVDLVWETTTGDTTQVIAILDTGVDWNHPDLKNKIWKNPDEIEGNGQDNDGNGFIDDIRGWDFINNDNNPMDDNSHGTHVAGIAAAEGNNGIGIAGVNWGAKIMPIKILDNKGRGDAAIISQGIIYASSNGASILNMSFGGYSKSFTMEAALMDAIAISELVAAAGNDRKSIYPSSPDLRDASTMYPAAFNFVLGVQVVESFSNYDPDGPIKSEFATGENYELISYGGSILSSVPAGLYRIYSGTSMGAPLVSGIISLYNQIKNPITREERWSDFIHLSRPTNANTNIFSSTKFPVFDLRHFELTDTLTGNDYDNQADAGEIIHLWTRIRNSFGQADSTFIKLQLSDISREYFSDHIEFTKDVVFLGSISPFGEKNNQYDPFIFYLEPTFPNESYFELEVLMWDAANSDTSSHLISIVVFNGTELSGFLEGDIVLTPDKLWLINNSTRLTEGSTMKILPGTHLILNGSFDNRGYIEAIGSKDSLIIIEGGGLGITLNKYVKYFGKGNDIRGGIFNNCEFYNGNYFYGDFDSCKFYIGKSFFDSKVKNSFIDSFNDTDINSTYLINNHSGAFSNNTVQNSVLWGGLQWADTLTTNNFINNIYSAYSNFPNIKKSTYSKYNNFVKAINGYVYSYPTFPHLWQPAYLFYLDETNGAKYYGNNFIIPDDTKEFFIVKTEGSSNIIDFPNQYWGTTDLNKVNSLIYDFNDNASIPLVNIQPLTTPPSDSAHGVVWKILVNGQDAQDEITDPIGVGIQRFDIYFNRPMNPNFEPQVTFGRIYPYLTDSVKDSSSWSHDYKIWTAYKTIQLHTGDGINRIRVADARDTQDFEIPVEDMRFEFVIDAAGLSSVDFNATAGLGKIELDWIQPEDVVDLLGYNLYRFTNLTDTTYTDTLMINNQLITDTTYTDFDVIPGDNYYYQYTVVKTDFNESERSKVVGTEALTASAGDANGDLSVTVQDIVSIVAYLLNQNPQPFILEAADVNGDSQVNILDIVATVNIIMSESLPKLSEVSGPPKITFDKKRAYIEEGEGLAGLQFKIVGTDISKANLVTGEAAKEMEISYNVISDTMYIVMFSFKNQTLNNKEKEMLFSITEGYFRELKEVTGSNQKGEKVEIGLVNDGEIIPKDFTLYQNYPNPFNPTTTIRYALPKQEKVEIRVFNILGQKVWEYFAEAQQPGYYEVKWNSVNSSNRQVATGVYIYQIRAGKFIQAMKMLLLK
ncbi:MAG: S8 family serine peptidase [Melioribacteraceae bacterium]|nr:MAG: S8 family serine peptidase [Melioribacteraceae bacterium]